MRSFKFGNWENDQAFPIIEKFFESGPTVYTLRDIYYVTPLSSQKYKIDTESGYNVIIHSFANFKLLLKNQLITLIDLDDEVIWELPGYQLRDLKKKYIQHYVNYFQINRERRKLINDDIKTQMNREYSFENRYPHSSDAGTCAICMDPLVEDKTSALDKCGHMFHTHCVKDYIREKGSCPNCRSSNSRLQRVMSHNVPRVQSFGHSKKCLLKKMQKDLAKMYTF